MNSLYQEYYNQLTQIEKKYSPENLYFKGDFSLLECKRRISVVGSRKVSEQGKKRTEIITKRLVDNDIIVVSGLAEGVDTIAHKTSISSGGHTIAVIGTPLNQYYPKQNTELQDEIGENHLLISQFEEGQKTYPSNFPMRNRTMALISDATIIIEASEESGTKHQGWEALRLGRQVFILENVIENNISWANEMIQYGAQVLNKENIDILLEQVPETTSKFDYAF